MGILVVTQRKNTVISPNFLVWKFWGQGQFPHSFGRIAQNYAETGPFCKISTPGNQVTLRYFLQWCIRSTILKDFYTEIKFSKKSKQFQNSGLCERSILYFPFYLSLHQLLIRQFCMETLLFQSQYFQVKNSHPVF